jgi:hypothetical protein
MAKPMVRIHPFVLLMVLLAALAVGAGCASTEPDNASARPWNTPQTWETGMPPGMYQGR